MKIVSARYLKSALQPEDCPKDQRPEVAFVGRSNVGKSSLINTLLNHRSLAKISKSPGKTRTLNFFDINSKFYVVDLPGYGYAKAGGELKALWEKELPAYLRDRENLKLVVSLIDARHDPSVADVEMLEFLGECERPTLVIATKVDKLKRSERKPNFARIRETLNLDPEALLIPFSSVTREGVKEAWQVLSGFVE